jgi:hypothetical protein
MTDEKTPPRRNKPAYVQLTDFGYSLFGIGFGIFLAQQYPSLLPWGQWIFMAGVLLLLIGWVCRVWVTEKVD